MALFSASKEKLLKKYDITKSLEINIPRNHDFEDYFIRLNGKAHITDEEFIFENKFGGGISIRLYQIKNIRNDSNKEINLLLKNGKIFKFSIIPKGLGHDNKVYEYISEIIEEKVNNRKNCVAQNSNEKTIEEKIEEEEKNNTLMQESKAKEIENQSIMDWKKVYSPSDFEQLLTSFILQGFKPYKSRPEGTYLQKKGYNLILLSVVCPHCGNVITDDRTVKNGLLICNHCLQSLSGNPIIDQNTGEPMNIDGANLFNDNNFIDAQDNNSINSDDVNFCPKCGKSVINEDIYCRSCGFKIR